MNKIIKILGVIFSIVTVAIAVSFFLFKDPLNQTKLSWLMVSMCGSLIFNGGTSYFAKKDKQGLLSVGVGIIILIFVVFKSFLK
ncbi:hypothetical protein [Paenibacillus sp. RC67]|uniref:hypothetical protein n=1 Tax=Paenibacillus sp. RC67 TaxID=3039392 RepID=UPI0024AE7F67|nr:hypothetical protein [Paenibacillus sp. RC67]